MVVGFSEQRWGVLHSNNSWYPVNPSTGQVLGVSHEEQQPWVRKETQASLRPRVCAARARVRHHGRSRGRQHSTNGRSVDEKLY